MAFYHLPNPYDPHYAIPEYVLAEPPGRGTFTTKWLPRGTIPNVVPDAFAKPVPGLGYVGETWLENAVPKVLAAVNAIMGYQRTGSMGWAAVWGLLGYWQPVVTTVAQGVVQLGNIDVESKVERQYMGFRGRGKSKSAFKAKHGRILKRLKAKRAAGA